MASTPDRIFMSAEEYLEWEPTQEERYEYWDGEVLQMKSASRRHDLVCHNVFQLLDNSLINYPCKVYVWGVKLHLEWKERSFYFYPDVLVTRDERDRDSQGVKFPCLIIEVLSPATWGIDRGRKFACYHQISTLQEYLVIHSHWSRIEAFRRNETGQLTVWDYGIDDRLYLESVDREIAIADVYRQVQFEGEDRSSE